MRRKDLFKLFLCFLPVFVLLAGCNGTGNENQNQVQSSETQTADFEIGSETESSKMIKIKNETEAGIIGLSAWPVGETFASTSILQKDQIVEPGSEAKWNFETSLDHSAYYIQIYLQNGTNFVLRDVDVNSIPDSGTIAVKYKDGIGYLYYQDTENKLVDTYEYQKSQEDQPLEENLDDNGLIGIPIND